VYQGRPASIDAAQVRAMKAGVGAWGRLRLRGCLRLGVHRCIGRWRGHRADDAPFPCSLVYTSADHPDRL
jgi:hypothetical protein